ncbi:MAG: protoporphyrinogen oxidase [Proteobacteria bacterium]|nr:protoporphyrinogen oxidase [Pseudomonadota bacterium]
MNDVDVLVIGAGISGLAIAHLLAQTGVSVQVWEQGKRPGGKIRTEKHNGYLLEQAASMVLNFRPEVNRFLSESGLQQRKALLSPGTNRYLLHKGQLLKAPMKLGQMITSPMWSLQGKLRLLLEPFIPSGYDENETVSEFIRRRLGNEFLERAMEPYIAGTLASDAEHANAIATLPRLTALEKRYGNLTLGVFVHRVLGKRTATVQESFSFHGGMATLIETLARNPGIRFRNGLSVTELNPCGQGWLVHGRSSMSEHAIKAQQVVMTIPADKAAALTGPLDSELQGLLNGIEYAPLSVVHTGFARSAIQHPLDGNGFLMPKNCGLASTGCLWMSSLLPGRAPEGKVLLSNYLGGARMPTAASWDEDQSVAMIMKGLKPLLGIRSEPEMVHIHRHGQGLPLYYGAYPARMQAINERLRQLPGLHLEANYRGGVSVRDRIVCAYTTTEKILSALDKDTSMTVATTHWANATA